MVTIDDTHSWTADADLRGDFPKNFSYLSQMNAAIYLDYQLDRGAGEAETALAKARGAIPTMAPV